MIASRAHFPDLEGRVALVTGGSRGLGAAVCDTLAANGAAVAVGGRDERAIADVVARVADAGVPAVGVAADVADSSAVARMVADAETALGPIDLVAAFAGLDSPEVPLVQTTDEDWRTVIAANLDSTFFTLRSVLPGMTARGHGSIVLMSSTAARRQTPASAGYTASKGAIIALTRKAAAEAGPRGVRVNCVAPSLVRTEGRVIRLSEEEIGANWPLGRLGMPDDVAQLTAFLFSDASSWLTGVTIDVAGGRVMP